MHNITKVVRAVFRWGWGLLSVVLGYKSFFLSLLQVLRLWLERKILPESIIRRHMRELDSYGGSSGAFSRRSLRTERSFDDPLREMEGMLVDEYGRFELIDLDFLLSFV